MIKLGLFSCNWWRVF